MPNTGDRDQRWIDFNTPKVLRLMEGWWGGQDDPIYAIASSKGNYAWVFEDAIANLDADLAKVKKVGRKYKLGKGTFTKAEIDELRVIRDALAGALEAAGMELDEFTSSYIETALWSSTDESDESGGDPLDENYGIGDIAPETMKELIADATDFQKRFGNLIESGGGDWGRAGHDFWLTRNEHGAGFWDGDWPEPQATELTNASHEYGECSLYVGDDGLIYGSGCGSPPRSARETRERNYRRPAQRPSGPYVTPRGGASGRVAARTGEIIPSKHWENKTTGATASIYGAAPWTGARGDRQEDWEMKTVGWTIRWSDGTIGIGRQPFKSQREAQDWLDKYNARMRRR